MSKDLSKLLKAEVDILSQNNKNGIELIFEIKKDLGINFTYFPQNILIDLSNKQLSAAYKLNLDGVCLGLVYDYVRYYSKNPDRATSYFIKLISKYNDLNSNFVKRVQFYQSNLQNSDNSKKLDITNSRDDVANMNTLLDNGNILGLSVKGHITCIRPVKNNKGYKVFDPNFGEFDCSAKSYKDNLYDLLKVIKYLGNVYKSDVSISNLSEVVAKLGIAEEKGEKKLGDTDALLNFALKKGNLAEVEKYLLQGAKAGNTPLHCAVLKNKIQAVNALIKSGANIETKDIYGNTALHLAITTSNINPVNSLINAGASLSAKNNEGKTARMLAVEVGNKEIEKAIIAAENDLALIDAAINGKKSKVIELIKAGANVNAQDADGYTALMVASGNGATDIVKALIDAKADLTQKDKAGKTALYYAHADNKEIKETLTTARDLALVDAAAKGEESKVNELIKAGANVNAKDGDGYTALIFASAQGNINIVKALIQAKADLTQTDQYNKTALDYAVDFEHDAIKSILQKAEATNSKYQNDPLIKAVDKLRQAVDNAKIEKPKSQEDSQHPEDKNIQSSI